MVINKIDFPIYFTCIILSLIITSFYILLTLKKLKISKKDSLLFILSINFFAIVGGFAFSSIINKNGELSSYAGAFSVIIVSIFYEKINPHNNDYLTIGLLSLPLIYSISKIGCFLAGCCYGIPYNGPLNVIYTEGLNISLVPIQLIEVILFFILFIVLNIVKSKIKNNYNVLVIITCALLKLLLDFFRYEHINTIITKNQIISFLLILFAIIYSIIKSRLVKNN